MIMFHIPGDPVAKGRARSFLRGGFIKHHTPAKTANYEALVALAAQQIMTTAQHRMLEGPLALEFTATFSIPKSWTKKRLAAHGVKPELVAKKPDLDNVMKSLTDGMNGVCYADDSQIARCTAEKVYGATPGVWVVVTECARVA